MKKPVRVLLGAVPFGENNVGDEAILECVIGIVRNACPGAEITVSTEDRVGTAKKFGVRTVPLYAFGRPFDRNEMKREMSTQDVFIWSGATGLSDYPENAISVLSVGQGVGIKTALWGVGMNDELNPAKYDVLPGRRRRLLEQVSRLTLGTVDAVALQEKLWRSRARRRIRSAVSAADLVVTRDFPTREQLQSCGVERSILVGADSAIRMQAASLDTVELSPHLREVLDGPKRKVGICISAQRELVHREDLIRFLDSVVADDTARVVFIPMNPVTDAALMAGLQSAMRHRERTVLVEGQPEPGVVTAICAGMDLVIASRLHLLILASIAHVPLIGIARGSKVDNFLAPYGLRPAGSVEVCDFSLLAAETQRLLGDRESFRRKSHAVRADLLARLDAAEEALARLLGGT